MLAPRNMNDLTNAKKKRLRAIGHQLKPVVTVASRGLVDTVLTELERALKDHELIKIKIIAEDRDEKAEIIKEVLKRTGALAIQKVGNVVLIYKPAAEPNESLSNVKRFGA